MAALSATLKKIARIIILSADWLADRFEDLSKWVANVIRFLPQRVGRFLLTVGMAVVSAVTFLPLALRVCRRGGRKHLGPWLRSRVRHGGVRTVQIALEALDIFGMPELFALLWRMLTRATPLTGAEIAAAATVLGPFALRYHDVRVAQGGLLNFVFRHNGGRAFCLFHTVNLPLQGNQDRANIDILLHELVHVLQYERAGSRYLAEALIAQSREGYGYGGVLGLRDAWGHGMRLRNFNREQQGQIVQDYFMHLRNGWNTEAFEPYIAELRAGKV